MVLLAKREKMLIGTAIFAVVISCFYMFVYEPKEKEALRLQEEIRTAQLEIERIVRGIPGLRKLQEEVTREQKRISLAKRGASGLQQMQQLLRQLARDVYRLDVDVIFLELAEESESPHEKLLYEKLTMVMDIQCPYRHLGLYLGGLRDLPGLVSVDGFQIVRDKKTFPKLQVKLTLTAFGPRS